MGKLVGGGMMGSAKKLKRALESGGASAITFIQEGSIIVRFLEEPDKWVAYYEIYLADEKAYVPQMEGMAVPQGARRSKRVLVNAVDVESNTVLALRIPKDLADRLINRYERAGTITDRDYELIRTGSGMSDTKYDSDPQTKSRVDLSRYKKYDLENLLQQEYDRVFSPDKGEDEDDYLDEEEDDEEETPKRGKARTVARTKPKPKPRSRHDDDDEDEDELDDEEDFDDEDDLDDESDEDSYTEDDLEEMAPAELKRVARELGVPIKGGRATVIRKILKAQ